MSEMTSSPEPERDPEQIEEDEAGGGDATVSSTESGDDMAAQLEEASREKDQFKRLAQRAQADLINYRKRVQQEAQEGQARSARRVALRILDVIDQLEVALAPEASNGVDSTWVEGVRAIHRNFLHAFQQEGFERFDTEGEQFDPSRHEALVSTPTTQHPPGIVIKQHVAGYTHHGEVVRPAKVEIAALPPDDAKE